MDEVNKSFRENIHFNRVVVWYSMNWMIIHFSKPPFRSKSSLWKISSAETVPHTAATTFAFFSIFILLL